MKDANIRGFGGFTLIELLVVVLIIGILSSVALPQYNKAVLKSRAAEAWSNLATIQKSITTYCLENPSGIGYYQSDMKDVLSVYVPDSNNFTYSGWVKCGDDNHEMDVVATYSKGSTTFKLGISKKYGTRVCDGAACRDLGFRSTGTHQCLTCGGMSGNCYYMD